jgi:hypothetical protein
MIKEEDLNRQIEKIINHPLFNKSKRSVSFLRYTCKKSIQGKQDHIKEYSIAVDAFGLDPSFDPQTDPRIRVEARRLRKKLQEYYLMEGKNDSILISIPKGSYIAEFCERSDSPALCKKSPGHKDFIFAFKGFVIRTPEPELSGEKYFKSKDYISLGLYRALFKKSDNVKQNASFSNLKYYFVTFDVHSNSNGISLIAAISSGEQQLLHRFKSTFSPEGRENTTQEIDEETEKAVLAILDCCEEHSNGRLADRS